MALERFEEKQRLVSQEWEQKEMGLLEKQKLALVRQTWNVSTARMFSRRPAQIRESEAAPTLISHLR